MRILLFSWRDPHHPNNGGAEQVTHEHAKAWVKNGHSVTLFTSMYGGAMWEEDLDGIHIVRRGTELLTVQMAAFFWYRKHKKDFDLVFDHFHGIPFFTPLYVRVKKVGFIHEVAKEVWKLNVLPFYIRWLPAIVGPAIERWTFKLFYKKVPFITVSESTKKDLINLRIPESHIMVIENGLILPKRLKKYPKNKTKTVMFLGAHAKDKGIEDAIKVFSHLNEDTKTKWQFWVVGRAAQSQIDEFTAFAKKLGITENITFFGFVEENKKFELLSKAHILINPSAHEGWGLVNLEANAVETPVVGYDVHGNRDSIQDGKTGILVPRNTKEMAKSIDKLLKDKKKYEAMRKEAVKWSKNFTWQKSTKESLAYLERMDKE